MGVLGYGLRADRRERRLRCHALNPLHIAGTNRNARLLNQVVPVADAGRGREPLRLSLRAGPRHMQTGVTALHRHQAENEVPQPHDFVA